MEVTKMVVVMLAMTIMVMMVMLVMMVMMMVIIVMMVTIWTMLDMIVVMIICEGDKQTETMTVRTMTKTEQEVQQALAQTDARVWRGSCLVIRVDKGALKEPLSSRKPGRNNYEIHSRKNEAQSDKRNEEKNDDHNTKNNGWH